MATHLSAEPEDDIRVGILGPLEVHRGEHVCALGGRQQRVVLALLVLDEGRVVSVDRIADALWGDHLPASYLTTIQTYVFRLRGLLEPQRAKGDPAHLLISAPGGGYRLVLPPEAVDAARFEAGAERGRELLNDGDAAGAAATLSDALALWRGDVLSDLPALEPIAAAAERLGEVRMAAVEDWATADLALGHHASVVPRLAALEAAHPLRERLAALRMVALYRSGRQAEALTVYGEIRQRLDDELGVYPAEELRDLHERILRQDEGLVRFPGEVPAPLAQPAPAVVALTTTTEGAPVASPAPVTSGGAETGTVSPVQRRRRWSLAIATIVVIASTLASLGITRSQDAQPRPVPVNSAAAVGPDGLVGDAVAIGAVPIGLAQDSGSVWVLDHTNAAVARVDPDSRRIVQIVPDVGNDPQAISAWNGNIWVAVFGSRLPIL